MSMCPQSSASSRLLIFFRIALWRSTSRYIGTARRSSLSLIPDAFLRLAMSTTDCTRMRKRLPGALVWLRAVRALSNERPLRAPTSVLALAEPAALQPLDLVEIRVLGNEFGRASEEGGGRVDRIPWIQSELSADVEALPEGLRVGGRDGQMGHLEDGLPRLDRGLKSPAHPHLIDDLVNREGRGHRIVLSSRDPADEISTPAPLLVPATGGVDEGVRIEIDHARRLRSSPSYAACGGNLRIVLPDFAMRSNTSAASVRVARRTIRSPSTENVTSVPGPILNASRRTFGMTTWPFGPTRIRISSIDGQI